MTPRTDAHNDIPDDLVRLAATGDRQAVTQLIQTIQPPVTRYCRAKLAGSPAAANADDAAQETCMAILRALPSYQFVGKPFGAYVYRVAANKCTDVHRAAGRGPARYQGDPDTALADIPTAATADGPVLAAETADEVAALLARLTHRQREIVTLRITENLTAPQIAELISDDGELLSPGAVRVALHRAMVTLRRIATREGAA